MKLKVKMVQFYTTNNLNVHGAILAEMCAVQNRGIIVFNCCTISMSEASCLDLNTVTLPFTLPKPFSWYFLEDVSHYSFTFPKEKFGEYFF